MCVCVAFWREIADDNKASMVTHRPLLMLILCVVLSKSATQLRNSNNVNADDYTNDDSVTQKCHQHKIFATELHCHNLKTCPE